MQQSLSTVFGDNLIISNVKSATPQVKIVNVGIEDDSELDGDNFVTMLKSQNHWLKNMGFSVAEYFKVPGSKRKYANVIIDCDLLALQAFLEKGSVIVGLSEKRVYEHITVLQCFNCQRFGHVAASCKVPTICRFCSKGHPSRDCGDKDLRVLSCRPFKNYLNLDLFNPNVNKLAPVIVSKNPGYLQVYCQNLSGAKSKIRRINSLLVNTIFDVIRFQETWFDPSITDVEIVSFTNFNIFRNDRADTAHHKKTDGGCATITSKSLDARRVLFESSILQYVAITFKLHGLSYLVVNIYIPFGTNSQSVPEYLKIIDGIGISYDEVIICGDFNLPNIRWEFDEEISGLMIPASVHGALEQEFVEATAFCGLNQILEQPDDRNHLDLAFVTAHGLFMKICSTILHASICLLS